MHVPTFFAINAFIDGFRLIEDALIAGSNSIKYVLFKIIYLIIIMPNIKSNKYKLNDLILIIFNLSNNLKFYILFSLKK